jgi:hypothetical protein
MNPSDVGSAADIARKLGGDVNKGKDGESARVPGPGHSAKDRSLSVKPDSGAPDGFVVFSFSGDDPIRCKDYVRAKLGLPAFRPGNGKGGDDRIIEVYDYVDESNTLLFQVVRYEPKKFPQRRPDPERKGEYIWSVQGVRQVPYRLPEIIEAIAQEKTVFIVEGEKDANNLWKWGVPATCNPGGAGKWRNELAEHFRGADIVLVPDNDEPGRKHADLVGASLKGTAARVRLLVLPDLPAKGDVTNWIESGGTPEDLDQLVKGAPEWSPQVVKQPEPAQADKQSELASPPLAQPVIKSSAEFVKGFVPPEYVVVGLLQRRFFYSLTGQTGAGKTAIMLVLAACTALGILFAGRETKKIRVLYLAAENADDVRMRWIALAQHMDFDVDGIEVYFVEGRFTISKSLNLLRAQAERHGGEFGLVVIDTGPTFFEGKEENENKQLGDHARLLRSLVDVIPGGPCVIANCHPTKAAADDNLLPRGGGAFTAEVDGNLTAAKTDSTVELHWQGKFRGPDFAPTHFLVSTVTHQGLKDGDGRLIPTVIAEHISDQARDDIAAAARSNEVAVLEIIDANPAASQATIAAAMGWKLYSGEPHKTKAARFLKTLIGAKLVKESRRTGRYTLTPEGEKMLKGEAD